jgi:hypothetical protein
MREAWEREIGEEEEDERFGREKKRNREDVCVGEGEEREKK